MGRIKEKALEAESNPDGLAEAEEKYENHKNGGGKEVLGSVNTVTGLHPFSAESMYLLSQEKQELFEMFWGV